MGKSILEEAVEDVAQLKRAAEENAKNLLVEAMSPRIKDFIQSHLGQEGVEAPGSDGGAPAGQNDTAHTSFDAGEDSASDDDVYEIEDDEQGDEDEDELEFDTDEDEDDEDSDADEDEDEDDEDEESPARKHKVHEASDSEDDDDSEDDEDKDDMDETLEITSEDLKKAFLSTIQNGLKEDPSQGKFGDAQDPNDGEYGLVHKVPGEVMWADGAKVMKKSKNAKMVTKESHDKVVRKLQRQLVQYHEAFKYLKKNLNEMNLFNAKLIYTTKLLQNNLSNKQKLQVVEKLDKARSKREVEFMFNTLSESFKIAGVLGEGRKQVKGPKASRVMKPGSSLNEGKTQGTAVSNRWAELAGLTE